ncbi:uncharacterized protein Bfra_004039 [Botrytis fragariae]|uniref:Uncharacterized protein n=1 Tax=Botrytis fragariae TaxID=1964551 RepID=A0A8H6AUX3_9HELO|nr:uncharacterized protein Bfra_004039 [Botrytis fragariae]KAF5874033.1 hypothetical protein Bfra_004039 [Botrytis fragariae]
MRSPPLIKGNSRSSLADRPALFALMHTLSNSEMWVNIRGGIEHGIRRLTVETHSETEGLLLGHGHRVGDV